MQKLIDWFILKYGISIILSKSPPSDVSTHMFYLVDCYANQAISNLSRLFQSVIWPDFPFSSGIRKGFRTMIMRKEEKRSRELYWATIP